MKKLLTCIFIVLISFNLYGVRINTGSYTGNGTSQSIQVTFQADVIIIISDYYFASTTGWVWKNSDMAADESICLYFGNDAETDCITAIGSSTFTVGNDVKVNRNTDDYFWIALADDEAGDFASGTYVGDGNDNRNITGLGFTPDFVMIQSSDNSLAGVWRCSDLGGDSTGTFWQSAATTYSDLIQAFGSGYFQVGTHGTVNAVDKNYYYMAIDEGPIFYCGERVGDGGDDVDVTTPNFDGNFIIMRDMSTAGTYMVGRQSDLKDATDDWTVQTNNLSLSNSIQDFITNGFQVGSGATANALNKRYLYFYFSNGNTKDCRVVIINNY